MTDENPSPDDLLRMSNELAQAFNDGGKTDSPQEVKDAIAMLAWAAMGIRRRDAEIERLGAMRAESVLVCVEVRSLLAKAASGDPAFLEASAFLLTGMLNGEASAPGYTDELRRLASASKFARAVKREHEGESNED